MAIFVTMYTTVHCISLRTVKHSDSKNILSVWSRELGRVSMLVPAGAGREARRRRALSCPLSTFECECDVRPGRELLTVRDVRPMAGSLALDSDPSKSLASLFLAEALDLLLRRSERDDTLSDFLFGSLERFSALTDGTAMANFHLVFLYHLAAPMGIQPDVSEWRPGYVFDMRDGVFRASAPAHADFLMPEAASELARMDRLNYRNMHLWQLDHEGRNTILDHILRYYAIHLAPLTSLRSLDVLRMLH